eukprot:GHVS01075664.1.p1 GENE.GHVS01075664.1~~GHVS01075664.1.p1  ORF type:complete len:357 (+),score=78.72 GHVS01075664.1:290-1360(+)
MDDSSLEYVLLNKREVFVYKIPPRSPQGHRAEDWKECIWRGKLQVVARETTCAVKLLDVNTAKLFAQCPVTENYEQSVERTMDSSRYFALRVDDGRGRHAFIGMGFESRNDAFDFNCALSDYARRRQVELQGSASDTPSDVPQRDYKLKEGEKIKVELKGMKRKPRSRTQGSSSTTDSPSLHPFPSPPAQPEGFSPFLAMPPPPPAKNRAVRREKSPFDDSTSGGDLGDLINTAAPTSHASQPPLQPTGNVEQDLMDLEFTDFQAATPVDVFTAGASSGPPVSPTPPPPPPSSSDLTSPAEIDVVSDLQSFSETAAARCSSLSSVGTTTSCDGVASASPSCSISAPPSDTPHLFIG